MQELPGHPHQAGIAQLALPRYLQECEGPGPGPAGELLSEPPPTRARPPSLPRVFQDAKIEPEEFTTRLQAELKSSPQPYLIPFLKVSLTFVTLSFAGSFSPHSKPAGPSCPPRKASPPCASPCSAASSPW